MEILVHDLVFLTLVQYLPLEFDHLKSLIMQEGVCYGQGKKKKELKKRREQITMFYTVQFMQRSVFHEAFKKRRQRLFLRLQ